MAGVAESDVLAPPVTGDHRVHRLARGTELLGEYKDSAYQEPKYLVQRADGQVMQLPGLLYRVASSLDGRDAGQIAADINEEVGHDLTGQQVSFLVEERLRPVGLIAPDGAEPGSPHDGAAVAAVPVRSDPLLALRHRVGVIPAAVSWRIAGFFQALFSRPAWLLLLTAFVAVDVWIVGQGDVLGRLVAGVQDVARYPGLILAILSLTLASAAFHECGHVSACRYGGARPGDIGVGLYLIWPAFYSTVTDSYRLDRAGRLRTDLGGVYFNAVFMLGLGLLLIRTGEPWLLIALVAMHIETAWQFLPSIRLDGYYILADLVGVPDLFSYVRPAVVSVLPGRPTHPLIRELKPRARRLVLLWVLVVVPTLLGYAVAFLVAVPRVLPAAWRATLEYLRGLDAAARAGDVVATTLGVCQLFLLALPWLGTVLVLWSLIGMLPRRVAARWGGGRISATVRAAVRRSLALATLASLGALLVARVASVAASHPATSAETRLVESALGTLRDASDGPTVGVGELLARDQLAGYAALTGAFDRHSTASAGGRELAVLSSAILVACLVALVVVRRVPPLAVALPVAAALVIGPAVTMLATVGPGVLGAAWTAVGALVLAHVRHRAAALFGVLAIATGMLTEPMLAVPMAACLALMLFRGELWAGRPAWWPPGATGGVVRGPADGPVAEGDRRSGADPRRYRVPAPAHRTGRRGRWFEVALVLPFGALGAAVAAGRAGMPLDDSERAVLALVAAAVVVAALGMRRLRPPALAVASTLVLAALPWPGAARALLLALLAVIGLAALLTDAFLRGPVAQRPHPLLRGAVVVPVVVLTMVGTFFLPAAAPVLPHAELAAWITDPAAPAGRLAVPPGLWGDLVRDGVPADRLVRATTPRAASVADWAVEVGGAGPPVRALAGFGAGPTALTVVPLPPAGAQRRAAGTELAARRNVGSLVAASPRLAAPPDVLAALRDGSVDARVLAVLAELTVEHTVELGAGMEDPGTAPRHEIVITGLDGLGATRPEVAAALTAFLGVQAPAFWPSTVTPGPRGIVLDWASQVSGALPAP
jgi:putative peptide zinc metalloprotease protein